MRKNWMFAWAICAVGIVTMSAFAGGPGQEQGQSSQPSANPPAEVEEQNPKPRGQTAIEARLQRMTQQLNLTDQQREKIRPILRNEAERLKAVRSNSALTQGEARRRMRRIRMSTRQQISQILTPEQREKWQEMHQEGHGGGGHPPGGPPAPEAPTNPPKPQ